MVLLAVMLTSFEADTMTLLFAYREMLLKVETKLTLPFAEVIVTLLLAMVTKLLEADTLMLLAA